MNPTLTTLRCLPALNGVSDAELERLSKRTEFIAYKKKAVIVKQNELSTDVFFILSGFVKVTRGGELSSFAQEQDRRSINRKEIALAVLGPGSVIGELATLADAQRSASVISFSACELVRMRKEDFIDCLNRYPSFGIYVLRYLAKRLVNADLQIELFRSGIEARISALIRNLRSLGLPNELFPTNAEIARMVGATREMVSKVVKQMELEAQSNKV